MSSVIVLEDAIYEKLEINAENKGVTPEDWINSIVDEEFRLANLPRFSVEERSEAHAYQKALDQRFDELMKKKRAKRMGRRDNDN